MREEKIDGVYYRLDEDNLTAEVIEQRKGLYNDYEGDIIIRETVVSNEVSYLVTSIGEEAFRNCKSLKSIDIPKSVRYIGDKAFENCPSLTTIEVAKGNIVYDSRENCNALIHTATNTLILGCQNTTIPNGITSIGDRAFYECHSLTSIVIPNSVASIGKDAFGCCFSLKSINIPDSVTSIEDSAFARCESLKYITIPDSVTTIAWGTFNQCKSLKAIAIPESVRCIGDHAFEDCESLKYIVIPVSVISIGYAAFSGCKSLYTIRYDGTKEQWKKITLDEVGGYWLTDVECYDGRVKI